MSSHTTDLQLPEGELSHAAKDVVAERRRQIEAEGWTPEHEWWKPTDRRRDLVKAGALILAEIERLDRAIDAAGGSNGE